MRQSHKRYFGTTARIRSLFGTIGGGECDTLSTPVAIPKTHMFNQYMQLAEQSVSMLH